MSGVPADENSSAPNISVDGSQITFSSNSIVLNPAATYETEIYRYTNCLSASAPSNCTPGLQVLTADSNGNPLQNVSGGGALDPAGQYFDFGQVPGGAAGYGSAADIYVAATSVGNPVKITPAIAWGNPSAITYGTPLSGTQLDASTGPAGIYVYNPPPGTVLSAGSQTLSVTFTPTDTADYGAATASVQIVVTQAVPTVTWSTPSSINAGAALSTTQLDATASVPGTFVYSPPAGTVLSAGTPTLSVTFTPSDTTDYEAFTTTVTLAVNSVSQPPPQITDNETIMVSDGVTVTSVTLTSSINVAAPVAYFAGGSPLGFNSQTQSQQNLSISNIGQSGTALVIGSVAILPSGAPFTLSPLTCFNGATSATIPSAGFCNMTITYTGSSPTADTGTLVFTDNAALSNLATTGLAPNYAQSITLMGSGAATAPPAPPSATVTIPTINETISVTDTPGVPPPVTPVVSVVLAGAPGIQFKSILC